MIECEQRVPTDDEVIAWGGVDADQALFILHEIDRHISEIATLQARLDAVKETLPHLYAGVAQMEGRMGKSAHLDMLIHLNRIQEAVQEPEQ